MPNLSSVSSNDVVSRRSCGLGVARDNGAVTPGYDSLMAKYTRNWRKKKVGEKKNVDRLESSRSGWSIGSASSHKRALDCKDTPAILIHYFASSCYFQKIFFHSSFFFKFSIFLQTST
jgi:hypothetical protein